MSGDKDPVALMAQANKTIEDFVATQKKLHEEIKAQSDGTATDVKAAVKMSEELAAKLSGFSNQLLDIEQKMTDAADAAMPTIRTFTSASCSRSML